jgi:hypothetical protein
LMNLHRTNQSHSSNRFTGRVPQPSRTGKYRFRPPGSGYTRICKLASEPTQTTAPLTVFSSRRGAEKPRDADHHCQGHHSANHACSSADNHGGRPTDSTDRLGAPGAVGSLSKPRILIVGPGCSQPITVSLHDALLHLRGRSVQCVVCIDAICIINQSNPPDCWDVLPGNPSGCLARGTTLPGQRPDGR